jgi:hypothetical protein
MAADVLPHSPVPSADEIVSKMIARDNERKATLHGYTAVRRYVLENQRFHKHAEMLVRMNCLEDGSKQFDTISTTGWAGARKHVFSRLLEAESDASRPDLRERSRIIPQNYTFEMAGAEYVDGRNTYVMTIAPKTPNKYLMKARIWIDSDEYAIVRIEGQPAKNPSIWIKSVNFVHNYEKRGPFWFPVSDRSATEARVFGSTEVTIEYFDYEPNPSALSASQASVRKNLP